MSKIIQFIAFLFAPKGPHLSRKQYGSAVFLLLMAGIYGASFQTFKNFVFYKFKPDYLSLAADSINETYFILSDVFLSALGDFWPAIFLVLVGSFTLTYRMLDSKGIKSFIPKILAGIPVFFILNFLYPLQQLFPVWASQYNLFDLKPHIQRIASGYFIIALIGLLLLIYMGVSAQNEPEAFVDRLKAGILPKNQFGRFQFILAHFKLTVILTAVSVVLSIILNFVVRNIGVPSWMNSVHFISFICLFILGLISLDFMRRRLNNMGKNVRLYLSVFIGSIAFMSFLGYWLLERGIAFWSVVGLCLFVVSFLIYQLFFLYLALYPAEASNSLPQ